MLSKFYSTKQMLFRRPTFGAACPDTFPVRLVMVVEPGQNDPFPHAVDVGTQWILVNAGQINIFVG